MKYRTKKRDLPYVTNNHRDEIRLCQRATEKDKVPQRDLATVRKGAVLSPEEGTGDTDDRGKLAGEEAASAQSELGCIHDAVVF